MSVIEFPLGKFAQRITDADPDDARRAKAYFDMGPHVNDVVCMGKIAAQLMSDPDRNLYDFAVAHLSGMLDEIKARYYAMDFPS
jgi:hypothetical protein